MVKTEYDVLLEHYNSIELGTASVSLGQAIEDSIINSDEVPTTSAMQRAIANGTALITGNSGGYVVLKKNANGKPEELLILGPESLGDIDRAVNVWRFNNAGLGFSPNGYDGPYNAAWTYDGKFYVDWVTAGAINAALVNTGTITSANGKVQIVLSETGNSGQLIVDSSNFELDAQGNVEITGKITATSGKIGGSSGLTILNNKGFYSGSKSTLMSGENGIYVGSDGISIGSQGVSGKKKPIMWLDQTNERLNVMRLDFMEPTNTSPFYEEGHSLYLDDNKRLLTGGGMDIGGAGSSGDHDASAEFNTEIHNNLWANIAGGSDRRIKENIEEITTESALDFIMAARPVSFTFTKDSLQPSGVHHGFIAQEVEECLNDDWDLVPHNEKGLKFIRYQEIIADMVKVVQDQQHRIEALEAALKEKE